MTPLANIAEILSHDFALRALLAGLSVSLAAAVIGVVLVLKRYSMIGHGLADVGFASSTLALALGVSPVLLATPVLVAASFAIMAVSQRRGVSGDVAIGIASTGALAAGIIVAALSQGFNIDVYNFMFGSILSVTAGEAQLAVVVSVLLLFLFILSYNRLFAVTFDEAFAAAGGIAVSRCQLLISLMTALVVVIGMKMMGTLLISSLIIFPAVTARRLVVSFRALVLGAAAVSVLCFLVGLVGSFVLGLPTGASVVAANVLALCIAEAVARLSRQ